LKKPGANRAFFTSLIFESDKEVFVGHH